MLREFIGWLESGEKTPGELLEICRERIRERDEEVLAWSAVDPQPATGDGLLRGIPFGVKDIFETSGLPTEY